MARERKPVKLSEMPHGQFADVFVQLAEKKRGTTRDGNPYFSCKYRDAGRTVGAVPVWADSLLFDECQAWHVGQFFRVRAMLVEHDRYGPQLEIEEIRPIAESDRAEGFTELDFMERTRHDPVALFAELDAFAAAEIADLPLRALVQKLLAAHADRLKLLPAHERRHYPFAGGWLEHTVNVVRNCALMADRYAKLFPEMAPPLNRDLVVAAAVLHDIGRVKELEPGTPGMPPKPGVAGELFGHLFLAYDMIRDAARDLPELNPELLELLLHIVITHLQLPAWGSPRLPCIPEVLILHHVDDLDAKFEMYARCLAKDTSDGPFTDRDPNLGRPILKSRKV